MEQPVTELAASSAGLHEMFETLCEAGFTEDQALRLLGYMLAARTEEPP